MTTQTTTPLDPKGDGSFIGPDESRHSKTSSGQMTNPQTTPVNPLKIQGYNQAIGDAAKIVLNHCVRGSKAVGKIRNEILALKKEERNEED